MEFNFVQWALLFSLIILLELSLGFYGLQRLIRRLEPVSRKVEDFFLIYTFKQVVNFVSENDLVQQGLLGSLVAMGDKEFLDYMRSKIGDMKLQIEKIGNGISRFENARRSISRIFSLSYQIKIMLILSMFSLAIVPFIPYDAKLVTLGLMYGLEIVALYYTFFSIILYYRLSKDYSDVLKSIESIDSLETSK